MYELATSDYLIVRFLHKKNSALFINNKMTIQQVKAQRKICFILDDICYFNTCFQIKILNVDANIIYTFLRIVL